MFNIKSFFKFKKNDGSEKPIHISKDPVCEMKPTDGIDFIYNGIKYSFCSNYCKQEFEKDPETYIIK